MFHNLTSYTMAELYLGKQILPELPDNSILSLVLREDSNAISREFEALRLAGFLGENFLGWYRNENKLNDFKPKIKNYFVDDFTEIDPIILYSDGTRRDNLRPLAKVLPAKRELLEKSLGENRSNVIFPNAHLIQTTSGDSYDSLSEAIRNHKCQTTKQNKWVEDMKKVDVLLIDYKADFKGPYTS